jgi:type IV pilus secretin PilQ/predicted competence protein
MNTNKSKKQRDITRKKVVGQSSCHREEPAGRRSDLGNQDYFDHYLDHWPHNDKHDIRHSVLRNILVCFLSFFFFIAQTKPSALAYEKTAMNVLDTRVSFEVTNTDVQGVLKTLAEAFDLNIVVGEDVTGNVSLSLSNVRLEDALDLILETTGYYYSLRDNIILIQSPEKEIETEIVLLNYVKASEIKSSIEALLSEKGELMDAGEEDRIIIKELPKRMKAIIKEIIEMDHPPHQIIIEARMVEVEDSDLTAFGISWQNSLSLAGYNDGKPITTPNRDFDIPQPRAGTVTPQSVAGDQADFGFSLQETSADLIGGQLTYGITLGRNELATTIDALVRTNRAHILASPTIAAMDGEEAKIIIGEKFPFRENTLTAVGTTETTKFVDIGTALRVVPTVLHGNDIMLEIHPEVSSLNESLTAGPRINTREATTKLIVKDGQTIVIAGLIQHEKSVIRQKVPILGNIPIIGMAFRNKSTDFVRKELAVFITPYLMKPMIPDPEQPAVDIFSAEIFFNRGMRLIDEFGIESLGKSKGQRAGEAIANLKTVARNFPESHVADDALYQIGRLYLEELNMPHRAAEAWTQLVTQYPDSRYSTNTLFSHLQSIQKVAERNSKQKRQKFK